MSKVVWPQTVARSRVAEVLESSLENGRLGHALMLVGEDIETLDATAEALARAILGNYPHPDAVKVEPANKLRQIGVEAMRGVRTFLQTSSLNGRKVALIASADRLRSDSANLFLKVLEEPPVGSFVILTTTEPHSILPTILSRVMRFRLHTPAEKKSCYAQASELMEKFLLARKYSAMALCGLLGELYNLWLAAPESPKEEPETPRARGELTADEREDLEAAADAKEALILRAHRSRFLGALQEGFLTAFKKEPGSADNLVAALKVIERAKKFMIYSLNEAAILELAVSGGIKAYIK